MSLKRGWGATTFQAELTVREERSNWKTQGKKGGEPLRVVGKDKPDT